MDTNVVCHFTLEWTYLMKCVTFHLGVHLVHLAVLVAYVSLITDIICGKSLEYNLKGDVQCCIVAEFPG